MRKSKKRGGESRRHWVRMRGVRAAAVLMLRGGLKNGSCSGSTTMMMRRLMKQQQQQHQLRAFNSYNHIHNSNDDDDGLWRSESSGTPPPPPSKSKANNNEEERIKAHSIPNRRKPEIQDSKRLTKNENVFDTTPPPSSSSSSSSLDFLDKFKLPKQQFTPPPPPPPPQAADADEIFKKMKETGLIPNAVAMLHGLCQDGLVHEAMNLFGLMRDKGTIPQVVIYTAVVQGFCTAHKLDDAKRIFRKMQNNGVSPNAFSYAILIQALYQNNNCLDDALLFCLEMLEAGHSPNLPTFTGLVDAFCRDKGLEASQSMIVTLRHKGFFLDEKALRIYLDKKGPFIPLVWEAILGKKT